MADRTLNIPMNDVVRGMTLNVRVTGMNVFRARLWLGVQILKLAALVMGTGITVSFDD